MSPIKPAYIFTTTFCCLWMMVVVAASADDSLADVSPAQLRSLNAVVKNGGTRGWEQTRIVFVKCGTNETAFTVPQGMRVDVGNSDKITLTAPDMSFYLSFRIRATSVRLTESQSVGVRAQLLSEYAGAKITDEYQAATPEHTGRAFELQWTPSGVRERSARIALIPTEAGTIELTLVMDAKKDSAGTFAFNSILTTMRKVQDGKFEIVETTDAS